MGFPTENDHLGVFWGYHHLRKHPNVSGAILLSGSRVCQMLVRTLRRDDVTTWRQCNRCRCQLDKSYPGIPTNSKTMGVNISTIAYLMVLIIEIVSTIILMVVEAQGLESLQNMCRTGITPPPQKLTWLGWRIHHEWRWCISDWKWGGFQ